RHRLSLVHRIREHALQTSAEPDSVDRLRVGDSIGPGVPAVEEDDLVLGQLPSETDCLRRAPCDSGDLVARLLDGGRGVYAEDLARSFLAGEPGDHSRLCRSCDRADDDRLEEDDQLVLRRGYL